LLEGTRYTIEEVLLPEQVPESLAAALQGAQPEKASPGDDDLLERAATQTILHGGSVYMLEPAMIPGDQFAAAVFRY
jgi:hypothetical protein